MTLSEFLLARIAEDEADIGDLTNAYPWESHYGGRRMEWTHDGFMADPRHLLAECEAKRRIVEMQREDAAHYDIHDDHDSRGGANALLDAMRVLTQPYADHPDFQSSWSLTKVSE